MLQLLHTTRWLGRSYWYSWDIEKYRIGLQPAPTYNSPSVSDAYFSHAELILSLLLYMR